MDFFGGGLVIIFPITWQFWNTPYFQTKPSISFVRPSTGTSPGTFLRREESQDLVQQRIDEAKYKESYGQLGWALVLGGQKNRPKWDDDLLYLQVSAGIRRSMTASNQLKMDSEKDPMTQSINDDQPRLVFCIFF